LFSGSKTPELRLSAGKSHVKLKTPRLLSIFAGATLLGSAHLDSAVLDTATQPAVDRLARVNWRELGPLHIGGRINDIAVPPALPNQPRGTIMYIAGTGGVWRTTEAGGRWKPIFDHQSVSVVNRIAIAPSNSRIVWLGTGDPTEFSHAMAPGNGVYKSVDGGDTWTHVGLDSTRIIGRIAIDSRNPDIVYVAAMGPVGRASRDRGVYRTMDGGKTWKQVLVIDDYTGAIDVAIDPFDPNTIYAGMWQASGLPSRFLDVGPQTAIYKSSDGGSTWRRVNTGLATNGPLGRIAVSPSPAKKGVVYAQIAIPDSTGDTDFYAGPVAVYRSNDSGESWKQQYVFAGSYRYYTFDILADPKNADRVFSVTSILSVSNDGGKTFRMAPDISKGYDPEAGGDMHVVWVDPDHTDHIVTGHDVAISESNDGGSSWRRTKNISLGQFRAVAVDRRMPFYRVYGESQDHHGISGPIQSRSGVGISAGDWRFLPIPEAGPIVVDPTSSPGK
jgi:photosystem II stability/assembly factor-like uncharacterized protein